MADDPNDKLQFDRVSSAGKPGAAPPGGPMRCSSCGQPLTDVYYHIAGKPICGACREKALAQIAQWQRGAKSGASMARAVVFGLGAALAGAAIYYAVMAFLNLEIGIVAILIGYMVGYSIRKATQNAGGRRYQVLAVALTYFAVAVAYSPFAIQGMLKGREARRSHASAVHRSDTVGGRTVIVIDSSGDIHDSVPAGAEVAAGDSTGAADSATAGAHATKDSPSLIVALGAMLVFIFALPVIAIVGSMPSGLISALIIGIGLRQAWRMTGAASIEIRGPFRVGTPPPAGAT